MSALLGTSGPLLRLTAPLATLRPRRALRLVERNLTVYRKGWIYIASGFLEPFLYLLSIGIGLGKLVGPMEVGGRLVPYAAFVAPGLLASSAMNGAIVDTTYNLFYKLKWAHTYEAVLATPLSTTDVAFGEIGWSVGRGTLYGSAFLAVMAGLGLIESPYALFCLPVAVLVSLSFAALGMAATSHMRSWQDLDMISLAVLPMFLFSGTFYPLSVYPTAVAWVVGVTPLYQGVTVLRALATGEVSWSLLWHVAYLVVLAGASLLISARRLKHLLAS